MLANEQLMKKWEPILEHADAPRIADSHRRSVTAQLLENQEWALQQQSEALTEASDTPVNVGPMNSNTAISKYDPVLISLVRRSMPNLIAYDICGVQPMTGPTGLIFALRPKYINTAVDATTGAITRDFGDDAFYNEALTGHSGDGAATEGTSPSVLNDAAPGAYDTGRAMSTEAGEYLGTTAGDVWQEMGFEIEKLAVQAKTRALKAQYSVELAQDLKNVHGLDAETELANILSTEIMSEINREVIRSVYLAATPGCQQPEITTPGTFDLDSDSNGRWAVEKFKGLMFQLERESNAIAKSTRRGKGNIILCSADVASALSMAGMLDHTPALSDNLNVDDTGNTFAGVLNGRYRVYIDPYHAGDQFVVMGYKGSSAFDAGIFYAPYVPLQLYKTIGEDSFQPRMGFKTRYGMVSNPFAKGGVSGNQYGEALDAANPGAGDNVYYRRFKVTGLTGTAGPGV